MINIVFKVTKWFASSVCIILVFKVKIEKRTRIYRHKQTVRKNFHLPVISSIWCRSSSASCKFSTKSEYINIVGKSHNHLKYTEGLVHPSRKKIKDIEHLEQPPLQCSNSYLNASQLPIEKRLQRPVNQRLTNSLYRAPAHFFIAKDHKLDPYRALLVFVFVWHLFFCVSVLKICYVFICQNRHFSF